MVLLPYRFTLFSNVLNLFDFKPCVLLPYRFTLFSNCRRRLIQRHRFYYLIDFTLFSNRLAVDRYKSDVLLPYRFTLFSNGAIGICRCLTVLLPYRFTLFSNGKDEGKGCDISFTTL